MPRRSRGAADGPSLEPHLPYYGNSRLPLVGGSRTELVAGTGIQSIHRLGIQAPRPGSSVPQRFRYARSPPVPHRTDSLLQSRPAALPPPRMSRAQSMSSTPRRRPLHARPPPISLSVRSAPADAARASTTRPACASGRSPAPARSPYPRRALPQPARDLTSVPPEIGHCLRPAREGEGPPCHAIMHQHRPSPSGCGPPLPRGLGTCYCRA